MRTRSPLPDDPVVHAAMAAYVSDMTGNGARPLSIDEWEGYTDASLDHALWFHRPIRVDEWSFFDVHCDVNHAGRSLIRGSLYDGSGRLCLSMAQEMLIRPVG
jgi:acyl-CoA thioesterase-2